MRVWMAQLKCPQGHCVLAAFGEYESREAAAALCLQLGQKFAEACKAGVVNHKCDICQSTDLHVDLNVTIFRTMEEARAPLEDCQRQQLETREFLKRSRN